MSTTVQAAGPLDVIVGQRIKRYLQQLAPHQADGDGPQLLREALAEIDVLAYWGPRWEAEHKENERLREVLKKANAQAEHFEREWYLRGDAIEALLACPSGMYCDAYPAAEKKARALLVPNDQAKGPGGFSPGPA